MARQHLGKKKVMLLRQQLGLDIIAVLVRGGTDHRRDLCLADGTVWYLDSEGHLEQAMFDGKPMGYRCENILLT